MKMIEIKYSGINSIKNYGRWNTATTFTLGTRPILRSDFTFKETDITGYTQKNNNYYNSECLKDEIKKLDKKLFLNKKKIGEAKTYYFCPQTKFDRAYFKRLYPDLVYTRIIENADLVIYDDYGLMQKMYDIKNIAAYCYTLDKCLYVLNSRDDLDFLKNCIDKDLKNISSNFEHRYFTLYKIKDSSNLIGKLIRIEDLINLKESEVTIKHLDINTCLTLVNQAFSNNLSTKKAAVETILNYSDDYKLIKLIIASLCEQRSRMKSSKLSYFVKVNSEELIRYSKYGNTAIFNFVNDVVKKINSGKYSSKNLEMVAGIINCDAFQGLFMKKLNGFKTRFEIPITTTVTENSIEDFKL